MADKIDYKTLAEETRKLASLDAERSETIKSGIEGLTQQRDLMGEIAKHAKGQNQDFDKISKSWGKNIENLSISAKIHEKINEHEKSLEAYQGSLMRDYKEIEDLKKASKDLSGEALGIAQLQIQANEEQTRANYAGLNKVAGQMDRMKAAQIGTNAAMGAMDKITGGLSSEFGNLAKMGGPWAIAIGAAVAVLSKAFQIFEGIDKAATDVRKSFGVLRSDGAAFQKNINEIGMETAHLGVDFAKVGETIKAIGNNFNTFTAQNKELTKNIAVFSTQMGVSADESAEFLKNLGGVTRSTAASNQNLMGFAAQMSKAAGVPLGKVMKDVSEAAKNSSSYIKASGVALIKAAVEARQMGTSLQQMADTSRKMLDFQSSIGDEMEASVLLGKNVNFQRARELAFRKDAVGASKEVLKIAKQVDFSSMDPLQMEAFAKASGKSVGELQDMLQADKEITNIKRNGTKEQKAQLEAYENMKKMKEKEAKDTGAEFLKRIQMEQNQERMAALQAKINQLFMEAIKPIVDAMDPIMEIAVKYLPSIIKYSISLFAFIKLWSIGLKVVGATISMIGSGLSKASGMIGKIGSMFSKIGTTVSKISSFLGKIITPVVKIAAPAEKALGFFGKIGGFAMKILGTFGKFLGPLGLIINVIQFIGALMKRWQETPKGFLGGLKAIGLALYDVFLKPFVNVYNWINDKFHGKSPSKLGLGIVTGLKAVGGMLLDVLTYPFKLWYKVVSGIVGTVLKVLLFPFKMIGKVIGFASSIGGSIGRGAKGVFSSKKEEPTTEMKSVTPLKPTPMEIANKLGLKVESKEKESAKEEKNPNQQLVQKIDELINLMKSGAIGVNIDGNRASYLLAKNTRERGGLGATA